eukprot:1159867-Pelagomonas_calceolata.AAC.10
MSASYWWTFSIKFGMNEGYECAGEVHAKGHNRNFHWMPGIQAQQLGYASWSGNYTHTFSVLDTGCCNGFRAGLLRLYNTCIQLCTQGIILSLELRSLMD